MDKTLLLNIEHNEEKREEEKELATAAVVLDKKKAVQFLIHYGFIAQNFSNITTMTFSEYINIDDNTYSNALLNFQEYLGITNDGELNNETYQWMLKSRCGNADVPAELSTVKRSWPSNIELRYALLFNSKYNTYALPIIEKAFEKWETITNLKFVHDRKRPNILVSFTRSKHECQSKVSKNILCRSNFDGKGGVLAHAYYPSHESNYHVDKVIEIHVDEDENWWFNESQKAPDNYTDFYMVILHEIGHSLGLEHSSNSNAVMFSFYHNNAEFDENDIEAIENLYGKKQKIVTTTTTTAATNTTTMITTTDTVMTSTTTTTMANALPEIREPPSFCSIVNNIRIFFIHNKRIYAVYKQWLWGKDLDAEHFEPPQDVSSWVNYISNADLVQGVYLKPNGHIEIFYGEHVLTLDGESLKLLNIISQPYKFLGKSPRVTALTATYANKLLVFVESSSYYYIAPLNDNVIAINAFVYKNKNEIGFPQNVTAALRYTNGIIYLMDDKKMYEYDEFRQKIIRSYKKDWSQLGIKCFDKTLLQQLKSLLQKLDT